MSDTLEIFGTEYTNVAGIIATNSNDTDLTYIRPQGTKSISANGNSIDVTEYASVDVSVPTGTARTSSDLTVSGDTVTAPAGLYASSASKSVASGTAGTPTATKGTVSNHSVSVTPSVTNTTGYITGSTKTGTAVTVSASELVSGSETKTSNGTYDVTNLASLVVNVSGGGGATNFVTGTFTTGSTTQTAGTFTIPYTGTGYPIMLTIVIEGGANNNTSSGNTTWYNSKQRYAIGLFSLTKTIMTEAPTYDTSGAENYGVVAVIYKNSASTANSYSRTSSMSANSFTSSSTSADNTNTTAVRFKGNGTTVSYYIGHYTSSSSYTYGLMANTTYRYYAVYSS